MNKKMCHYIFLLCPWHFIDTHIPHTVKFPGNHFWQAVFLPILYAISDGLGLPLQLTVFMYLSTETTLSVLVCPISSKWGIKEKKYYNTNYKIDSNIILLSQHMHFSLLNLV